MIDSESPTAFLRAPPELCRPDGVTATPIGSSRFSDGVGDALFAAIWPRSEARCRRFYNAVDVATVRARAGEEVPGLPKQPFIVAAGPL